MTAHESLLDIAALSLDELQSWAQELGLEKYRAVQIFKGIHGRRAGSFEEMTDLPKSLRGDLAGRCRLTQVPIRDFVVSGDGSTKFVFGLEDGWSVESVLIPEERRTTLCLSTQVGCGLGCVFCLTGTMGLKRNLSTPEILSQVYGVQKHLGDE